MNNDIATGEDIRALVNTFYDKVKTDDTIGHIFNTIIGADWSRHLPVMYTFWETILLNKAGYRGNVINKHLAIDKQLPLQKEHFDRWYSLWTQIVDSLFAGPVADEAKNRASLMLHLISTKVDWSRLPGSIQ